MDKLTKLIKQRSINQASGRFNNQFAEFIKAGLSETIDKIDAGNTAKTLYNRFIEAGATHDETIKYITIAIDVLIESDKGQKDFLLQVKQLIHDYRNTTLEIQPPHNG